MAKVRVPLHQNPRNFATVEDGATKGAQLGRDLYDERGQLLTRASLTSGGSDGGPNSIASTIWKLIREVPANIQKLAVLVGRGFAVRRDDGEWALRTLQEGTGIDIANPDGEAGNPTIGLEDLPDSGAGALLAITRDAKGRVSGTRAATITGTADQIDVANGDAAAGVPTVSLAAAVLDSLADADSAVQSIVPGTGIAVDNTDPRNPVVSATGGSGSPTFPFILQTGASYIPLTGANELPFFLADGSASNIPVTP